MAVTWPAALGWRLERQLLDPVGGGSVHDVVAALGAVPAWPDQTAELGVGVRRRAGRFGDTRDALAAGRVVKVYAFRGALHLMTPQHAGAYLALRRSSRMWELKSWVDFYDLAPQDWPAYLDWARAALDDGPLTRTELVAALRRSRRYRQLAPHVAEGNDTILKPLSWHGVLGLGTGRDGEPAFLRLEAVPGWSGVPDLDTAGLAAVRHFLRTCGPTTRGRVHDWFGKGLGVKNRALDGWLEAVGPATVAVEGADLLVLEEDLDSLRAAQPSRAVRLLPGRDPWIMAPGTTDTHVVPPALRPAMSRSANPVLVGGVVCGTWALRGDRLEVTGRVPRTALEEQVAELGTRLGRPLVLTVA